MGIVQRYASHPLFRNYLRVFSVDVLVKASAFILLPIYLAIMTQDEFGLYGYLVAIISTSSLVLNLGMYVAQSKLYHDYPPEDRGALLFTLNAMLIAFIVAVIAVLFVSRLDYALVAFLFKHPFQYETYRGSIALGVIVAVYALMLTNYFLTSDNIRKVQYFNLCRLVFVNAITIWILWRNPAADHSLERIKYANIVEFLIIVGFAIPYVRRMTFSFNWAMARKSIGLGLPIVLSAVIGIVVNLSDRYFIETYGTRKDLSIYNLALTFSMIIPFVFVSFQNVWLPHYLREKDRALNRSRSRKVVVLLTGTFLLLSVGIYAMLYLMVTLGVIDRKYDAIMLLLPIVLATGTVASLTGIFSNHLIYRGRLYLTVVVGLPLAAIGIGLNYVLYPIWGIYGAAVSTLLMNIGYLVSYALLERWDP